MLNLKIMDELTEFGISLYNINECKNGRVGGGVGKCYRNIWSVDCMV